MNPVEDAKNPEHMQYAKEQAQYYYPLMVGHIITKHL
jgi:hypothetical protein